MKRSTHLIDDLAEGHIKADSIVPAEVLALTFPVRALAAGTAGTGHGRAEGLETQAVQAWVSGSSRRRARPPRLRAAVDEDCCRHRRAVEIVKHLRGARWTRNLKSVRMLECCVCMHDLKD